MACSLAVVLNPASRNPGVHRRSPIQVLNRARGCLTSVIPETTPETAHAQSDFDILCTLRACLEHADSFRRPVTACFEFDPFGPAVSSPAHHRLFACGASRARSGCRESRPCMPQITK